jgi:Clostripain family.
MKLRVLVFFLLILYSCRNEDRDILPEAQHTLIVYIAGDNDLSEDATNNLRQMEIGYRNTGAKMLVFIDTANEPPKLLEINGNRSLLLKTYPEFNSASAKGINNILSEITVLYPSDSYGLILWSHGTSWLPAGSILKSFGDDSGKQINISELAEALPVQFEFILFDACLMGAVEVAYELKDKAHHIIAPSTETIADGFPYALIIPELLAARPDLNKTAKLYFDFYNKQHGANRSATISLINTQGLGTLAEEMKKLIQTEGFNFSDFDRYSVQRLDVYTEQYHFDLLDFIDKLYIGNKNSFIGQLNKTMLYKAHTPRFIELYDINTYCGLSCYIPHPQRKDLNAYYSTLKWSIDTSVSDFLQVEF